MFLIVEFSRSIINNLRVIEMAKFLWGNYISKKLGILYK